MHQSLARAAVLLLGAASFNLLADCGPADPAVTPAGLATVRLKESLTDLTGERFLGLDGERVLAGSPAPDFVLSGGKVSLPPAWPERVDWQVYPQVSAREPGLRLYFDQRADGSRRLCRVEEMAEGYAGDGTPSGKLEARRLWTFRYTPAGQLDEAVEYLPGEHDALVRWSTYCYRFDDTGRPYARHDIPQGSCADARLDNAVMVYVHSREGRLLRTIAVRNTPYAEEHASGVQTHYVVQTYDASGHPRNRYLTDGGGEPFRIPPEPKVPEEEAAHDSPGFIVMGSPDWQITLLTRPEEARQWKAKWRFVLIKPEYLGTYMQVSENAVAETIAAGVTNTHGSTTLTPAQQRKLFERVRQYPGRVMLRVPELGLNASLMPLLPQAQWKACIDPARREPAACE